MSTATVAHPRVSLLSDEDLAAAMREAYAAWAIAPREGWAVASERYYALSREMNRRYPHQLPVATVDDALGY